jgi:hypothetical protein
MGVFLGLQCPWHLQLDLGAYIMRYMALCVDTSMSGTDQWIFYKIPENVSYRELEDFGFEMACNNAESFGIYVDANLDMEGKDDNETVWGISHTWEPYKPEKHDTLVAGGGLPEFHEWD